MGTKIYKVITAEELRRYRMKEKEAFSAKATPLADLIEYQEGSVVSRTILDKEAGTVTLFAFDKGEGLSEHTAPYDAIVYVLEGEVRVLISSNPILVSQGEMVIMPAGKPHALEALSKFKMLLTMIKD